MRLWIKLLCTLTLLATLGLPAQTSEARAVRFDTTGLSPANPLLSLTLQLAIDEGMRGGATPSLPDSGEDTPPTDEPDPPGNDDDDEPEQGDELQPYDD